MDLNLTAICITTIICATVIILCWMQQGGGDE